jgi:hypothetical protein
VWMWRGKNQRIISYIRQSAPLARRSSKSVRRFR